MSSWVNLISILFVCKQVLSYKVQQKRPTVTGKSMEKKVSNKWVWHRSSFKGHIIKSERKKRVLYANHLAQFSVSVRTGTETDASTCHLIVWLLCIGQTALCKYYSRCWAWVSLYLLRKQREKEKKRVRHILISFALEIRLAKQWHQGDEIN